MTKVLERKLVRCTKFHGDEFPYTCSKNNFKIQRLHLVHSVWNPLWWRYTILATELAVRHFCETSSICNKVFWFISAHIIQQNRSERKNHQKWSRTYHWQCREQQPGAERTSWWGTGWSDVYHLLSPSIYTCHVFHPCNITLTVSLQAWSV